MLDIKNLTIIQNNDLRTIVKDLSFTLNDGDKMVIIGEEGNGKSTIIKLIYDEKLIEGYAEYTGVIGKGELHLGYLAQELSPQDKALSVYNYMCSLPTFFEFSPKEMSDSARSVGLKSDIFYSNRLLSTLSGGERVKLQLARMLLLSPDVYLLDEPSNDLDIETLEWLERFINRTNKPILYVSHDETLIERTATSVIHIERLSKKTIPRHTVARMPYAKYIAERNARFQKETQLAVKEREEFGKKMDKFRRIQQKVEHQQNVI